MAASSVEPVSRLVTAPEIETNPSYKKTPFIVKLHEMGFDNGHSAMVMEPLGAGLRPERTGPEPGARPARGPAGHPGPHQHAALHPVAGRLQLRNELFGPAHPERAHHLPGLEQRKQRHRGRPFRPLRRGRRGGDVLRHLHRLQRPRHPAPADRDPGFPPLPGAHPQRHGGAEQGHGAVPAADRRQLRDAFAPGRREPVPHVLGQPPLLEWIRP